MMCKIVQPRCKLLAKCSAVKDAARTLSALYSRDFFDITRMFADGREKCGECSWAQLITDHLRL